MVCGRGGIYGIHRGGINFGGLGLKDKFYGSSVSNVFEGSFNEEVTGEGKDISEGSFKYSTYDERKKLYSTASADWGAIGEK